MGAQRQFLELMRLDVQRTTSMTTSKDQELVEENSKLKVEIATLRKQLQDKESVHGQTEGSTFNPRRKTTQVQGQKKEQTKRPVEVEERPSFQDVPIGHDMEEPHEETHVEIEPKRQEL